MSNEQMTNEEAISFDIYLHELLEWNSKFNLTSITDPEEIRIRHFEDSLALLQVIKLTCQRVIDIGAGAGFPGIPLKIACPDIKLTLLEATRKKVDFLQHLIGKLDLLGVEIIWGRAEEVALVKRECFDLALARAVAPLNTLYELCLPFVNVGGQFIAYKEDRIEDEVHQGENALHLLGGELCKIAKAKIPNTDIPRSFVIIKKACATPAKYPRRPGMAKKNPL
jgi:16S rRNA (guanine527-N7)-methyltransferase